LGARRQYDTPLDQVMRALGIGPARLLRVARRLAPAVGIAPISRSQLSRLRSGEDDPTRAKILLLVAAVREIAREPIRAADMFRLEPLPAGPMNAVVSSESRRYVVTIHTDGRVTDDAATTPEDEFEAVYQEHGGLLRTIATTRFGIPTADAEALVHDVFIAYFHRRMYIRDVRGWLIGATANVSKRYWRSRQRETPLADDFDAPAAANEIEEWSTRAAVAFVLRNLGEKCRETLRRYYLDDETKELIAQYLQTSPGYVLHLLVSCRKRAREILERTLNPK
jgi:RNA polymerase sigma factor (sigma-70 family)